MPRRRNSGRKEGTCCVGFTRLINENLIQSFAAKERTCYRISGRGRSRVRINFCPVCGTELPSAAPRQFTLPFQEGERVLWRRARYNATAAFAGLRGRRSARIQVGDGWHTVPLSSLQRASTS